MQGFVFYFKINNPFWMSYYSIFILGHSELNTSLYVTVKDHLYLNIFNIIE